MKYFKLTEFEKNGAKITDKNIEYNVINLVDTILDKAREYYGKPIYVLEGYNPKSDHLGHSIGIAAEITTKSKQGNIDVYEFLKTLKYEELSVNGDYESIHISSYPVNRNLTESAEDINDSTKFLSDYLVCLDSGHGKDVAGKRSPDSSLLEWEWTRNIKYRVKAELEKQKIAECFDVNPEDTEPGLTVRANRANKAWEAHSKKGIFVSIHVNAAGNGKEWVNATGYSVYVAPTASEDSKKLAQSIYNEVEKADLKGNRSVPKDKYWTGNFTVLTKTKCPAVLIENLFMTNKEDLKILLSEEGQDKIVNLIVTGIKNFLVSKK